MTQKQNRSAALRPAVQDASRIRVNDFKFNHRGYLPHLNRSNGIYFVTFRLAGTLPKSQVDKFKIEIHEENNYPMKEKQLTRKLSQRIDNYLDQSHGMCHLKNPQIASLVANAIQYFDEDRYRLFAWCVMPNHVHVLIKPNRGFELSSIMQSWKSYSAKEANKVLNSQGRFWQREYYDHLVRNEDEFGRIARYVWGNPIKAGLVNWKWVWIDEEIVCF